jgi:hypothetical protein
MPINSGRVHACERFVRCGLDVSLTRYHETVRHVVSALPALTQLDGYVFLILMEEFFYVLTCLLLSLKP